MMMIKTTKALSHIAQPIKFTKIVIAPDLGNTCMPLPQIFDPSLFIDYIKTLFEELFELRRQFP